MGRCKTYVYIRRVAFVIVFVTVTQFGLFDVWTAINKCDNEQHGKTIFVFVYMSRSIIKEQFIDSIQDAPSKKATQLNR